MAGFVMKQAGSVPARWDQAIGVFDSGSGGMVAASYLARMLKDSGIAAGTYFFGDTANLPYGKRTQENVAALSDAVIERLAPVCPVIGIACNTASAAWSNFGRAGKAGTRPQVFSVVQVAAELGYERARTVLDARSNLRTKVVGVLGTELTATIQSHAAVIVQLHRAALSKAIGHELPLVPYEFGPAGLRPTLPAGTIDFATTPHIGVLREDEQAPGGTTRAAIVNWDPPAELPQAVRIVARDAQKLVAAVDVAHILDEEGRVKMEWRDRLSEYLAQVSQDLMQRRATSLILGCTHFEYFERDFSMLLPTLAARGGIVSPSGALATRLLDAYLAYIEAHPVQPVVEARAACFQFSGERPPDATFKALGLAEVTLVSPT
ncbi:Glutamate racemase [Usitatibacter rugosus]|uniref:Glutamate racemase n=1 Tax=Usitatibacter rugosus TaxID=2732067 RepID=A0A6M4H2T1_9PROT|nr:hypothetical protein [Usitatibacter rugosus]QJR12127.1 Glutamate racemase [Usitatibacter rugosus]